MRLPVAGPARRVDRLLADEVAGLSRSAAARLIRVGDVLLNGHPARVADQAREGDVVEFDLPSSDAAVELAAGESIPLHVVYEDSQLVVVDKPAGMVVHPAAGHRTATLVHALLGLGGTWSAASGELRPGIVHRLDRDTSGLIAAARTDAAHRSLAAQLADRTMYRTYLAIVRDELNVRELRFAGEEVSLDTEVTPELRLEGLARDIVRQVQQLRKDLGLNIEDRIRLRWRADGDLAHAIKAHADYIKREVLAVDLVRSEDDDLIERKIEGVPIWLSPSRAG